MRIISFGISFLWCNCITTLVELDLINISEIGVNKFTAIVKPAHVRVGG
jgi:hypothetical protein